MLPVLDEEVVRHRIAKRIALDFEDGAVVNLGIGIPTLVSDYLPGCARNAADGERRDRAGRNRRWTTFGHRRGGAASLLPGSSIVASDMSFGPSRSSRRDGARRLEVDSHSNLANWMIPGKMVPGMGGRWIW